ncbi:hypothetical protein BH23GEM9_BH23GEM9_11930 [soil metagenome]
MRRFRDRTGTEWDVVLGRESWGSLLALFVPRTGDSPVRQAALMASSHDAATRELNELSDTALRALFDRSSTRDEGSS